MTLRFAAIVFAGGLALGLLAAVPMRRDLRSLGRQFGIGRWAAGGCYTLAVAGIASVTAVSGSLGEHGVLTAALWLVYFPGWFGIAYAAGNYGRYRRLRAAERVDTGDLRSDDGHVAVSGTATPVDGPATTPLLGEQAVCYTWSAEEHRRWPQVGWYTAALGQGGVPFLVDDGSGPVAVAPDGADLRLAAGLGTRQVDADERPPAAAAAFLDGEVGFDLEETTHRYREEYVPPGETVYVLGRARSPEPGARAASTDRSAATAVLDGGAPFVVGTGSVEAATRRLGRTVRVAAVGGAVAVLLGYTGQLLVSGWRPF